MAEQDMIIMSTKELKRLHLIRKVIEKVLKQKQASELLRISTRQIRRITRRVRQQGDEGVIHGSRGQRSHNAWDQAEKERIKSLVERKYRGFGPTLISEKLFKDEKIGISDETIRQWLIDWGQWDRRNKKHHHRHWRERKSHRGEMVQMDGSHHRWLEARGPILVLMGYVDDATNEFFGRFYDYEGTIPALDSFKRYIRRYGLPQSVYLDKHTTYKSWAKPTIEEELNGKKPLSQFERALKELGVEVIHANSPQAKGRVERVFRTLQDRLVKELRLNNAKTQEQANEVLEDYLPEFNRRFRQDPLNKSDLHRPALKSKQLEDILCIKTPHPLRNDYTLVHKRQLYQVLDKTRAKEVIVEEKTNGRMLVKATEGKLRYKPLKQRPEDKKSTEPKQVKLRRQYIPPADSLWRQFALKGSIQTFKNRTF